MDTNTNSSAKLEVTNIGKSMSYKSDATGYVEGIAITLRHSKDQDGQLQVTDGHLIIEVGKENATSFHVGQLITFNIQL